MKNAVAWDYLNRLAILVTIIAGFAAFLSFIGAQTPATLVLVFLCFGMLGFLAIRLWYSRRQSAAIEADLKSLRRFMEYAANNISLVDGDRLNNLSDEWLRKSQSTFTHLLRTIASDLEETFGFNCTAKCLVMQNGENGLIARSIASSSVSHKNSYFSLPAENNAAAHSMQTNRPLVINNTLLPKEFSYLANESFNESRSFAIAPITSQKSMLGVLSIESKSDNSFTPAVMKNMEFYSEWCRIMILHTIGTVEAVTATKSD